MRRFPSGRPRATLQRVRWFFGLALVQVGAAAADLRHAVRCARAENDQLAGEIVVQEGVGQGETPGQGPGAGDRGRDRGPGAGTRGALYYRPAGHHRRSAVTAVVKVIARPNPIFAKSP